MVLQRVCVFGCEVYTGNQFWVVFVCLFVFAVYLCLDVHSAYAACSCIRLWVVWCVLGTCLCICFLNVVPCCHTDEAVFVMPACVLSVSMYFGMATYCKWKEAPKLVQTILGNRSFD